MSCAPESACARRRFGSIALSLLLVAAASDGELASARASPPSPPRFPAADSVEAWKQLPREEPALPAWALVLVRPLPRTTGAMLELDYLHRAHNPLGPVLAGKLRLVAADALGCDYGKRYAEADLRRVGLTDEDLTKFAGDPRGLPAMDRCALGFARKLTRAGHTITDAEVAEMLKHFGPEKMVAIVHTLAHASFQNRIWLALGIAVEPGGPLPPFNPQLDVEKRAKLSTPARPAAAVPASTDASPHSAFRAQWQEKDFLRVQNALEQQRGRKSRIPLPDPSRLAKLPPETKEQASKIVWTNVSMGYQPQLTKAWFDCMRTFQQEANLDRVFSNTVFWVVTRSNECFY